jgi:hypothetical protein
MWIAALLALGLGSGQLVAYQGIAPHAQGLLSNRSGRAVLHAGRIVVRDLSALAVTHARRAASDLVLLGLEGTASFYRFAQTTLGVSTGGSCGAPTEVCEETGSCPAADAGEAVTASEPDAPCAANPACAAARSARACPPCPACPARGARSTGRAALSRVLVIVGF